MSKENFKERLLDAVANSTGMMDGIAEFLYNELHPQPLKVLRTDDAKQFPLINAKKEGDVGFDLPAVLPYKKRFQDKDERAAYKNNRLLHEPDLTDLQLEVEMRESLVVNPGERIMIPTGIRLEIPHRYWAAIEARSSTSKQMLICPKGVIDEGYRGELFAVLLNVGKAPVEIFHGDRYVQLIIAKRENEGLKVIEVDELSESERGDTGFGSTKQSDIN